MRGFFCLTTLARRLDEDPDHLPGRQIRDFLPDEDAAALRRRLRGDAPNAEPPFLLNFVGSDLIPFTLQCLLEVRSDGFVLLGEPLHAQDEKFERELISLNNQLAVLSRENERKRKALARKERELRETLAELETSYWHLKKIQEVLPTCMRCGKVKTGEHTWDDAIEYLRQNSLFLSHGYCPRCEDHLLDDLGEEG